MNGIPYNIARGAASSLQMQPPFAFSDVTMSVFPLRASLSRLETFCNNYLNQAPHLVQFKPFIPFVYLVILDYGRMSLQAANMGWVSQREVAFGIPLRWLNMTDDGLKFHDWAFSSPFIFVDNELSMSTGREVYGWPKLLAKLDPSVSEWVRDPHGARRVFQVSTKRAAHAYAGEVQEYRPFLSVHQNRAAGMFDIPPSMETITKPIQQLSATATGFTRLGVDLAKTFAGMASDGITGSPILPEFQDQDVFKSNLNRDKLRSWSNPRDWLPGMRDMLWSMFPRTYANTINFKQFRDAGDPHATCYQSITTAKMPAKSVSRGGFLGPQNMLLGQLDGGFRIDVHSLAGLPIVESLGLEVSEEREADGTHVSSLTPVCPLWMQVDMTYGLADTLIWRGIKDSWHPGDHLKDLVGDKAPKSGVSTDDPQPKPDPVKPPPTDEETKAPGEAEDAFDLDYIRTMNFFNTARGASEAVGGAFTMPNASIRVLPIKADHAAMNKFASEYLKIEGHLKFEAWGDFVYLIICDFDQMNSTINAVAKRRAREINMAVPVKCYSWFEDDDFPELTKPDMLDHRYPDRHVPAQKAYKHLVTTGFVSAFSFVDDTGTAITASEVAGIPTLSSKITSPENDWLSIDMSKDRAKRDILDLSASVLPALMSGAQAQERSLVQVHSHTPPQTKVHETQHESVNSWVGLLGKDIEQKTMEAAEENLNVGQGLALQIMGGDLPINQFSLKQFRDSRHTDEACYQGLVQRRHKIQKLADMRELEEPLHVSITDYPTQPIGEILGLKPKFSYPGPDRVVQVYEALRPFSINADLVREAGNTLFERVKSPVWQRGDAVEQLFGWSEGDEGRARRIVDTADQFDNEDHPVELRYNCAVKERPRPFRLHSRKVLSGFLKGGFDRHLKTGKMTDLFIRERNITGLIHVVTEPELLAKVSNGEALDIAAFNAQMRRNDRTEVMTQASAAAELALLNPATISDSILSRQWGLAPGSRRRQDKKPDFCIASETVPNQFAEALFPTTERMFDYWPLSKSHFDSEMNRRSMEVLSFRSEISSFVGSVSVFIAMRVMMNGEEESVNERQLKKFANEMRELMDKTERTEFALAIQGLFKAEVDTAQKYTRLYTAFANSILPEAIQLVDFSSQQALMPQMMNEAMLMTSDDWTRIRRAVPRLLNMAAVLYGQDDEFEAGVEEMSETLIKRAKKSRADMRNFEQAYMGDIEHPEFYLQHPGEILEDRLYKLVTGEALNEERNRDQRESDRLDQATAAVRVASKEF